MSYSKIKKVRISKYDKLWSALVRKRDGRCLYALCNKTEFLNAHHFKGRSCKSTRLMLANGVSLCSAHHVFSSEFSAHKTPEKFDRWFKKTYPDRYKAIIKRAQTMMTELQAIKEFEAQCINQS
jgi:hypothetical protein